MRLVFAGTASVAVTSLAALLGSRHEVVAVITRPDAPAGRGRAVTPSPVRLCAQQAGLAVLDPIDPRDDDLLQALRDLDPDCCPVVAYGGLLPEQVLSVPAHGWVNLHFSLLPAWRGAAPVQWAIMRGDEITGACTFRIGPGLDDGPIFGCVTEEIGLRDTAGDLLDRLAIVGAELLVHTLDAIEDGSAVPVPQPLQGVSRAPRLTVEDARVRWTDPVIAVDRRIRATTPSPGAWTSIDGVRVKLRPLRAGQGEGPTNLLPGQVRCVGPDAWVGTATQPALLGEVQPQGRKLMSAADWIRGLRTPDLTFDSD